MRHNRQERALRAVGRIGGILHLLGLKKLLLEFLAVGYVLDHSDRIPGSATVVSNQRGNHARETHRSTSSNQPPLELEAGSSSRQQVRIGLGARGRVIGMGQV